MRILSDISLQPKRKTARASESDFVCSITIHADKETDWPLRFRYDYTQPFVLSLDFKLVETNISELKIVARALK